MKNQISELEFDRQVKNLLSKKYSKLAKLSEDKFLSYTKPLKKQLKKFKFKKVDFEKGKLPFVLVVKSELVDSTQAMGAVEWNNKSGLVKLYPREPKDFKTIEELKIPKQPVYLLINIDRGQQNINLSPSEAFKIIKKQKRSPLTIDEGIAIITQYPDVLVKNNCFSLLGSRFTGDKRVPAIWINGKKQANLGWCWDGNPHTWLGSASCENRI